MNGFKNFLSNNIPGLKDKDSADTTGTIREEEDEKSIEDKALNFDSDSSEDDEQDSSSSSSGQHTAFSRMLTDRELNDITLLGSDGVRVPANRAVLASKSRVFRKLLLGSFAKPINDGVVQLDDFKGAVIRGVVEYVLTDSAAILEKMTVLPQTRKKRRKSNRSSLRSSSNSTHSILSLSSRRSTVTRQDFVATTNYNYNRSQIATLVALTAAAGQFQLPALGRQALACLTHLLHSFPSKVFAVLQACRHQEKDNPTNNPAKALLPNELNGLTQSSLRNFMGPIEASDVDFLTPGLVSEIIHDEKLRMGEFQLFELLQYWANADEELVQQVEAEAAAGSSSSVSVGASSVSLTAVTPKKDNRESHTNKNIKKHDEQNHSPTSTTASTTTKSETPDTTATDDTDAPEIPAPTISATATKTATVIDDDTITEHTTNTATASSSDSVAIDIAATNSTDSMPDIAKTSSTADSVTDDHLDLSRRTSNKTPTNNKNNKFDTTSDDGTSCANSSYPTFAADLADRKTMVIHHFIKQIRFEYMDPKLLGTVVAKSGLVSPTQLLHAFQQQALAAQKFHGIAFSRPRNRLAVWRNCMSETFTSRDEAFKEDVLQYPPMTSGIHRWNLFIDDSEDCTWLGLRMSTLRRKPVSSVTQKKTTTAAQDDDIHDLNWVYSNDGDAFHGGARFGENLPGFGTGSQVTLTLNLLPHQEEEEGDGTLSVRVNGGESHLLFHNLRAHLLNRRPGEGYVPSISMHTPGRVRLVDIRQLQV